MLDACFLSRDEVLNPTLQSLEQLGNTLLAKARENPDEIEEKFRQRMEAKFREWKNMTQFTWPGGVPLHVQKRVARKFQQAFLNHFGIVPTIYEQKLSTSSNDSWLIARADGNKTFGKTFGASIVLPGVPSKDTLIIFPPLVEKVVGKD